MNTPNSNQNLSIVDRTRIAWAAMRFDFWLDLQSVSRKKRRELRHELKSNLRDAAAVVGLTKAIANIGPLRTLAAETTSDGQLRSRWTAGVTAAITTFTALTVGFLFLSLYYTEGVLDSGVTGQVQSSLFPFLGSNVTVDPSQDGIAMSVQPGFLPLAASALVFLLVARPWRALRHPSPNTDTVSC